MSHVTTPRPLTQLPGTEVYMAPEAFKEPPEYTSKLDCFSLGILVVQIITRKFPCPGSRRRQISVPKSDYAPSGQAEVLVSEVERRSSHIALIDEKHPLLLISLNCLKDDDKARPTAEQLLLQLSVLKESVRYRESVGSREKSGGSREEVQQLQRELEQAVRRAEASEQLVADFQQSLNQKDETLKSKDEVIRSHEVALHQKQRQIEDLQRRQEGRERGGQDSEEGTEPIKLHWRNESSCPIETNGERFAVQGKTVYFCDVQSNTKVLKYNSETGEWAILECPKKFFSIAVVKGLVTAVSGEQSDEASKVLLSLTGQQMWSELFPPMIYHCNVPGVASTSTSLIVAGGWGLKDRKSMAQVELLDLDSFQWSTVANLPHPRHQSSVAICGGKLYVGAGLCDGKTYSSVLTCALSDLVQSSLSQSQSLAARLSSALKFYSTPSTMWTEIAELPVKRSSLVVLQGRLLSIGGIKEDGYSSAVLQYDTATNTWKSIGHMNNKRSVCLAASLPGNKIIVVGGFNKPGTRATAIVETASIV